MDEILIEVAVWSTHKTVSATFATSLSLCPGTYGTCYYANLNVTVGIIIIIIIMTIVAAYPTIQFNLTISNNNSTIPLRIARILWSQSQPPSFYVFFRVLD